MIIDKRPEVPRNAEGKRITTIQEMWKYKNSQARRLQADGTVQVFYYGDADAPVVVISAQE